MIRFVIRFVVCIVLILVSILVLMYCCLTNVDYEYLHDPNQITSIQIVEIGERNSEGALQQTVIAEIENTDEFLKDFEDIDCSSVLGDPQGIYPDMIVIKFIYDNGDYELIAQEGKAYSYYTDYTEGKPLNNYTGFQHLDPEQFDDLISKYTKDG